MDPVKNDLLLIQIVFVTDNKLDKTCCKKHKL